MAKLLNSTPRLHSIHRHTLHLLSPHTLSLPPPSSISFLSTSFHSHFISPHSSSSISISRTRHSLSFSLVSRRNHSVHAFDENSDSNSSSTQVDDKPKLGENDAIPPKSIESQYPSGEFEFKEFGAWKKFVVKCRMLIAYPWQRVKKGSVLTVKLRGQVSDQLKSRFTQGLSLPQLCENFIKAAYDPRIAGVYLHIEPLNCGWGKVEEIRRHILDFRKSGE